MEKVMKRIIVLLGIVLPVCVFSMDDKKGLMIINGNTKIATVRYEPTKTNVPVGALSCYVSKSVDAGKFLVLPPLLTPLISVTIDGFDPLENLPIVTTHIPLEIHPLRNNEITITQDTQTRAILKALINTHPTPQVKPAHIKPIKKEESDEDCRVQ